MQSLALCHAPNMLAITLLDRYLEAPPKQTAVPQLMLVAGITYQLTGAMLHAGCLTSGHYRAVVRHPSKSSSSQWWLCDDEAVTAIPGGGEEALLSGRAPYMLFYTRT